MSAAQRSERLGDAARLDAARLDAAWLDAARLDAARLDAAWRRAPVPLIGRPLWRALGVVSIASALLLSGCIESTFTPLEPEDASTSDVALADTAELDALTGDTGVEDGQGDGGADDDVGPVDTSDGGPGDGGTGDAADAGDAGALPDTADDAGAGDAGTVDADDGGGADAGDADDPDVPVVLPFGATCTTGGDCASGTCLPAGDGTAVCSEICDGECPVGFRCQLAPATGSTSLTWCVPLAGSLCQPCALDSDCVGGKCVSLESTGAKICALDCGAAGGGADACPAGFVCQSFLKGEQCVPVNDTCTCDANLLGAEWPCAVSTAVGSCAGAQFCDTSGWTACTAPLPSGEVCDGIDNDCDGEIDDGVTLLVDGVPVAVGGTCGTGACAGGKVICDGGGGTVCSTDAVASFTDPCDGVDNDCDGTTDEDCPPSDYDDDGTIDQDDCKPYNAEGYPGAAEACCLAMPATPQAALFDVTEQTDGCDLNCDGKVTPCLIGDGDGDGFVSPADCNDADASVFPGAPEKCDDGVDQDCSGLDLSCAGLLDGDNDGFVVPTDCNDADPNVFPGAPEVCNYVDDDCDGIADDGNPAACSDPAFVTQDDCINNGGEWLETGIACGDSAGTCEPGVFVCKHLGFQAKVECVDGVGPADELCNGLDDDCDNSTDEDFSELGQACDGPDLDACENGQLICADDGLTLTCGLESSADKLELCDANNPQQGNGVDEDCDGITDEACYNFDDVDGDGFASDVDCNDLDAGFFPGSPAETCCDPAIAASGLAIPSCDRNCDGQVTACDPNDKDLDGFVAGTGPGQDCDDFNPTIYPGAPEVCGDGIDQNCDVDDLACALVTDKDSDGFPPPIDCNDNLDTVNPHAIEKCNLIDDDCDGLTDEDNPGAQPGACGGDVGACVPGVEACVRFAFQAVLQCIPKVGPQPELCNGIDDNCNGQIDEAFPLLGEPCDGADLDQCANGTFTCGSDGLGVTCENEGIEDLYELCDAIDNDCDGDTDEGMTYFGVPVGGSCDGVGACGGGQVVCSPKLQLAVCSTDAFGTEPQASLELCNGVDDDCDGQVDEGLTWAGLPLGATCFGLGACLGVKGKVVCDGNGQATCSALPGGANYAGKAETCNGLDDDCDGKVDEGLSVADSTCKQAGVCNADNVVASCVGGTWSCAYDAVDGYQGATEVTCDGLDNDCDGNVDEEFGVGEACDGPDDDLCTNGVISCTDDKLSSVCGAESIEDIAELCNGGDDDCDGEIDEGFPVAEPCDGDDVDQCANGTYTCAVGGQTVVCVNESIEITNDPCNGLDDDCDGIVDNNWAFALGQACDGLDSDQCTNGQFECNSTQDGIVCGPETKEDIVEACNGIDDDCDGSTDEGQLYEGKALGAPCDGVGLCGPGNVICSPVDFVATCSSNPNAVEGFEGKELCDDLDNDCNGLIDDNLSYDGAGLGQGCVGKGECGAGIVQCGSDKKVTCSSQPNGSDPQGKPELCDDLDNDCNGETDDGLSLEDSNCKVAGVCADGGVSAECEAGQWQCDYSNVVGYEFIEISCDGVDNDCDGLTDEGFSVGQPCDGPDDDLCENGTFQCTDDGQSAICANETATNVPEVCDGLDNDCDGGTDEGYTWGASNAALGDVCDGAGACGQGVVQCAPDKLAAICSTEAGGSADMSQPELCNAVDDDCDGVTDDGILYDGLPVGTPCNGTGECGLGVVQCSAQTLQPVCSTNPGGTASQAQPEGCDQKDNDCDGQTDEDIAAAEAAGFCNTQGECASALIATCTPNGWLCSYAGPTYQQLETKCDGLDNDCNGVTDDPYPTLGQACDGNDSDKCANGVYICADNGVSVVCGPEAQQNIPELCNDLDDDCDGLTDELFAEVGKVCDGPDGDSCANGTFTCAPDGTAVQCVNEFPTNISEVCDGQDNDCDGATDEDFDIGGPCDSDDADSCKLGTIACGGGGAAVCIGDTDCAPGAICEPGDGGAPDMCVCGSQSCSSVNGNFCNQVQGVCTCNGQPACGFNETCTFAGCKTP